MWRGSLRVTGKGDFGTVQCKEMGLQSMVRQVPISTFSLQNTISLRHCTWVWMYFSSILITRIFKSQVKLKSTCTSHKGLKLESLTIIGIGINVKQQENSSTASLSINRYNESHLETIWHYLKKWNLWLSVTTNSLPSINQRNSMKTFSKRVIWVSSNISS